MKHKHNNLTSNLNSRTLDLNHVMLPTGKMGKVLQAIYNLQFTKKSEPNEMYKKTVTSIKSALQTCVYFFYLKNYLEDYVRLFNYVLGLSLGLPALKHEM